jgi:uncharacterized protein YecE (DUF72 family)
MSPAIYIGCSGFSFRDWKRVFYPPELPPRKWLAYYCAHFNSLNLNITFYRMPTPKAFETYYEQSPIDYRFAIKAPRQVTHYKKFNAEAQPILSRLLRHRARGAARKARAHTVSATAQGCLY